MYKLSILIPTHKRPELFQRALRSVLFNKPDNVQVIVNNDSNDITEIDHPDVCYTYRSFDCLSRVYAELMFRGIGDYVYYLEDDDYIKEDFYDVVFPLLDKYDIISGNYYPTYNTTILKTHENGEYHSPKEWVKSLDMEHLQLSKFVFRRNFVASYDFKDDSNVHNDIDMTLHAASIAGKFINIPNVLYYQTVDGGDNISFKEFNDNIEANKDFYENYKELWE